MPRTICEMDTVEFPTTRADQAADLMSLAGLVLTRGDAAGWQVLYRASKALEGIAESDSDEGRRESAVIQAGLSEALRRG